MRSEPVTRSEIRLRGFTIATLPLDSVRQGRQGRLETSEHLWRPLVRSLNHAQQRDWENNAVVRRSLGYKAFRKPKPVTVPRPDLLHNRKEHHCIGCGRQFYIAGRFWGSRWCSDACRSQYKQKIYSAARSA